MDHEDKESESRLALCRGCDNLIKREQYRAWLTGTKKRKEPIFVDHWFCKEYGLHLNFIDRIIGEGYSKDGKGKECEKFTN
jgi:hypothetical protein